MSRDTGIADRIRAQGVRVVECSGWQTRGSDSFNPRGSVNHHTAGPSSGATPSLNTCIYGRPDLAGPLCNVLQSREPDGNDIAYIVAAGRANHAGSGGWRGLSGNSSVYGLEIEHNGTSPLSQQRQRIAAAIHRGMFGGDPNMVCQHFEWTTRKIDAATGVNGDAFRNLVRSGGPAPTPAPQPKPEPKPEPDEDDEDMKLFCATPEDEPGAIYAYNAANWTRNKINQKVADELLVCGQVSGKVGKISADHNRQYKTVSP